MMEVDDEMSTTIETTLKNDEQSSSSSLMSPATEPAPPVVASASSTMTSTLTTDKGAIIDNIVTKLLTTYSKSISTALSSSGGSGPSRTSRDNNKRKLEGECFISKCTSRNDDLVIAPTSAVIYYHLNPEVKKVFKICKPCAKEAEEFVQKATLAAVEKECILKPPSKSQGMDEEDIVDITNRNLEDDPDEVKMVQEIEKEVVKLEDNLDSLDGVVESMLSEIDIIKQMKICEDFMRFESRELGEDFSSLDKEVGLVEQDMVEAKKMYDMLTGNGPSVPIILEEIMIDSQGRVKKSRGDNSHFANLSAFDRQHATRAVQDKTNEGKMLPEAKPLREANKCSRETSKQVTGVDIQADTNKTSELLPTPAVIPRVEPKKGSVVYAMNRSLLHFWGKGEILEVIKKGPGKSSEFIVQFDPIGHRHRVIQKRVTAKQIAYNVPCPFMLPVGARVLAKFKDELKYEPGGNGQYYAGVIAEPPKIANKFRYLLFFDDGYTQYVNPQDVLMVYESSKEVWADVHPDSATFIREYVQKYPERPMVRLAVGQMISTEWNGHWWVSRVLDVDCSLVKLKYESDGRLEWLYRGSERLAPMQNQMARQRSNTTARRRFGMGKSQPTIEYNYDDEEKKTIKMTARKSTCAVQKQSDKPNETQNSRLPLYDYGEFEGLIIKKTIPSSFPKPKDYVPHNCNSSCAVTFDPNNKDLRKMNPLSVVLYLGWSREQAKSPKKHIFYKAPCGKRLRDLEEVYKFLIEAKCEISIDYFCFDTAVDCVNEFRHSRQISFLPDLTYGKELTPVQVVNAFDFDYPPYVEYSAERIPGKGVKLNTNDEFLECCDCTDDCRDKSKCACWQLTMKGISFTKLSSDEYQMTGYEYKRLKDHIVSGVYECNSRCRCKKTCFNRVVQNGLRVPLQVFKTAAKGWGIRPLYDIPEGTFICIYAGQVLTEQGANEDGKQFGDEYLAELDYIECNEQVKADYESDVTDIEAEENDNDYTNKRKASRCKNGKTNSGKSRKNSDEDMSTSDDEGTKSRSRFNPSGSVNNKRSKIKTVERLPLRQYFGEDEQCYIMDAKTVGNIGRYLNHSCQPNIFVQNVFVDTHDLRFPWVAFFSNKHIRAGSELTWDYNYEIGSVSDKVMYCYCATPECRGRLL